MRIIVQREITIQAVSRFIFCAYKEKGEFFMPRNQFQRAIFALLTVIVTVHAYVLLCNIK